MNSIRWTAANRRLLPFTNDRNGSVKTLAERPLLAQTPAGWLKIEFVERPLWVDSSRPLLVSDAAAGATFTVRFPVAKRDADSSDCRSRRDAIRRLDDREISHSFETCTTW